MSNQLQQSGRFCNICKKNVSNQNYNLHIVACERQNKKEQQNVQNNFNNNQQIQQPQQYQNSEPRDTSYSYQANQIISDNLRDVSNRNSLPYQNIQGQQNRNPEERKSNQANYSQNYQNANYYQDNNGNSSYYHSLNNRQDETIKCPNCGTNLTIEMISLHTDTCPNRETQCQFCKQLFPQDLMNEHLDVCKESIRQQQQQSYLRRSGNFNSQTNLNQNRQPSFQQPYQNQQNSRNSTNNQRQQRQNSNRMEEEEPFQRQSSRNNNNPEVEILNPLGLLFLGFGNRRNRGQGNIRSNLFEVLMPLIEQTQNRQLQYFISHGNMEGFDYSNDGGLNTEQLKDFPIHKFQKRLGMSEDQLNCPVCLCEFEEGEEVKVLDCFHSYHSQCIDEWLKKNTHCPVCKKDMKEFV